jgi:Kdo2-lipid IVA lauroyltransferase/acyltransferase
LCLPPSQQPTLQNSKLNCVGFVAIDGNPSTSVKYRLKHIAEYGALRMLHGLMNRVPARAACGLGIGLAWLAQGPMHARVVEARRRIREVFGDALSDHEVKRIAWISLRNTFLNGVEVLRMGRIDRAWVERHIANLESLAPLQDHLLSGRGAILVVPHTGNWDLAGVATRWLQIPVFIVIGHQKNPLTDAFIDRQRRAPGIETISRHDGPLRKVIRNLRAGKVLAFMTDTRAKSDGVATRFLGKQAHVSGGMALFARQANVPIFPAVALREGTDRHRWMVFDPIEPDPALDKQADTLRMTQAVMDLFDREIRRRPDQYFWYNRRWVLDPVLPPSAPSSAVTV